MVTFWGDDFQGRCDSTNFLKEFFISMYICLLPNICHWEIYLFLRLRDLYKYIWKPLNRILHGKWVNFSVKNIWEQSEIQWNKNTFKELILWLLPWKSSSQKVTKFRNYMDWGHWVWLVLLNLDLEMGLSLGNRQNSTHLGENETHQLFYGLSSSNSNLEEEKG